MNHKKVHRLYCEEGLNLRSKQPRWHVSAAHRMDRPELSSFDQSWSMDSVTDHLFNGRRSRALTVVDNFSRECLKIHLDHAIKWQHVVSRLEWLRLFAGRKPHRIQVDNGSEFITKALDKWVYGNNVTLDFSRPGKPTDNPFIKSFSGSFQDECLNTHWFLSLSDTRKNIETWRKEYNEFRPHSSLKNMPQTTLPVHRLTFQLAKFLYNLPGQIRRRPQIDIAVFSQHKSHSLIFIKEILT